MNQLIKIIVGLVLFSAVLTIIGFILPDGITGVINDSFVYFLNLMVLSLQNLVHVETVIAVLRIYFNFTLGILSTYMVFILVHMIA